MAKKSIDAHEPTEIKESDVTNENDKQRTPNRIEGHREHLYKLVKRRNNVKIDKLDIRKYAVKQIVEHTQKMR